MLFTQARQNPYLPFPRKLRDAIDIADLVRTPDERNRLRAETLGLSAVQAWTDDISAAVRIGARAALL